MQQLQIYVRYFVKNEGRMEKRWNLLVFDHFEERGTSNPIRSLFEVLPKLANGIAELQDLRIEISPWSFPFETPELATGEEMSRTSLFAAVAKIAERYAVARDEVAAQIQHYSKLVQESGDAELQETFQAGKHDAWDRAVQLDEDHCYAALGEFEAYIAPIDARYSITDDPQLYEDEFEQLKKLIEKVCAVEALQKDVTVQELRGARAGERGTIVQDCVVIATVSPKPTNRPLPKRHFLLHQGHRARSRVTSA